MQAGQAAKKNFQDDAGHGLDPLKVQKIALAIFAKKLPFFVLIFIILFVLLSYIFWQQTISRPDRYAAYASLVYSPKTLEQYRPLDSKLVRDLFVRSNLRLAVASKLGLSPSEEAGLGMLIDAQQVKNQANFIVITCKGASAESALELNRAVVALGIEEFQKFRNNDLTERLNYLQKQKDAGLKELSEFELELQKLLDPLSLATPEQLLNKLRQTISGQLLLVSELNIKVNNLNQKINEINERLKEIDPNIQNHLDTVSYYSAEEDRLARELLRSRQLYTDQNPKVKAFQAELLLIREQKEALIKEKNLADLNPDISQRLKQLKDNLLIFEKELNTLTQQKEIAEQELEHNKKRSENLLASLSEENKLNNKIASVRNTIRKLDSDIPLLKTLLSSVSQELLVIEPASTAVLTDKSFLKKLIVALFLAGILVFNVALVWVAFLYFAGKIESVSEIILLTSIDCLGGFPDLQKNAMNEDRLLEISHDLFFKLKDYLKDGQILFEAGFVGSVSQDKIRELLNINFAMNGMRHFNLICDCLDNLKQHRESEAAVESSHADWEEELLAVEKINAGLGHFCVNNQHLLLSSEIEILTRDINILKNHYDLIVISRKTAFNGNELSFRQLTDFADSTVLLFGFRKTPRRILRYLARIKNSLSGQLCCLLTGVKTDDWA